MLLLTETAAYVSFKRVVSVRIPWWGVKSEGRSGDGRVYDGSVRRTTVLFFFLSVNQLPGTSLRRFTVSQKKLSRYRFPVTCSISWGISHASLQRRVNGLNHNMWASFYIFFKSSSNRTYHSIKGYDILLPEDINTRAEKPCPQLTISNMRTPE